MNTLILAILLLSGYVYVKNSTSARYKFKRLEGWGAYFYVAMCGGVFTVCSWLLCSSLSILGVFRGVFSWLVSHDFFNKASVDRLFPLAPSATFKFVDLKFAIFGLTAVILAWVWAKFIVPSYKRLREGEFYKFIELDSVLANHPLERMLLLASVTKQPVLVTMSSRKIYVGIVIEPRTEDGLADYLTLIPLLSGYRDKDFLTTTVTTNYQSHYEENGILDSTTPSRLTLDDFKILISFEEIDTISNFDSEAYSNFKAREESDKENSKSLNSDFPPS